MVEISEESEQKESADESQPYRLSKTCTCSFYLKKYVASLRDFQEMRIWEEKLIFVKKLQRMILILALSVLG